MSSGTNNDTHWIIGGAVAIIIVGMSLITLASIAATDAAPIIAAISTTVTLGLGGLFALHKAQETVQKSEKAVVENTKVTEEIRDVGIENSQKLTQITHQLNGERDSVANGIAQFRAAFLLEVREIMRESLTEWENRKS
jgi:hypothetical protein